jgi:hypothetical protein
MAEPGNATWHGVNGTSLFGTMRVVATDQHTGRRYRCWCGWKGWTVWGRARKHAETCPLAWLEVPEPQWREDGQGRQVEASCPAGECDWSSEWLGEWQRWTPAALRRRVEEHYVKVHGGCDRCGLPYAPFNGPLSGRPLRFGAVLDAHNDGQVCLWVPGVTPEDGQWMQPPPGLPEALRPAESTFDVVVPASGDLADATFYHQRRGHDELPALMADLSGEEG